MSDYKKKYTDLVSYIPTRYRTIAGTSILRNLHNKFLTKEESTQMLGYVGDKVRNDTSPYIPAANLDREVNSLVPAVYTKLGAEEHIFTFSDVLQKMKMLGVDLSKFDTWGAATSFNFVPPINLDKFTNYSRYRWYGHLVQSQNDLFTPPDFNPTMNPEYYVIGATGNSDWAAMNFWVHEEDANALFAAKGWAITIDSTIQAVRPIIEYNVELEQSMVLNINAGKPGEFTVDGFTIDQTQPKYKTEFNQKPLFNLYLQNGLHAGFVSPIFYYAEGNDYPVDSALKTRIVKDAYGDFTFEQGLISKDGKRTLFYKVDSQLHSIWVKGPVESPVYVEQDGEGAWEYPNQMFHNITHENRKQVGYGDLLGHFTDIIAKQPSFAGNPFGVNNFRNLETYSLGTGGRIKDYDTNFGLFLGLTNQLDTSIPSIIEFGKLQYAQLLGSISEFVTRNLADAINDGKISAPRVNLSNDEDAALLPLYKDFLTSVATRNDASVFSDTTSSIVGWIATIPYLGLGTAMKPSIYFETRTGHLTLRHHDFHLSIVDTPSTDVEKNIANMMFLRSDGQTTPGVSGYIAPARPYKNQFWFDANTNTLKYFNVKSDTQPAFPAVNGDLFYARAQNKLFMFENDAFVEVADVDTAWTTVNVSTIISQLTLMVENQLYTDCPFNSVKIDVISQLNEDSPQANTLLEQELAIYASKKGLDLYAGDYSPTDAFTWNYKLATIPGIPAAARWFDIYQMYFGTRKPNLQPWKLAGFAVKPADWDDRYADHTGTRMWTTQMWTDVKAVWHKPLGVDVTNDNLLPPYVSASDPRSSEALLTVIPHGIANHYEFQDNGPTEFAWRSSVDFNYDVLKTCFRIDPIRFVSTVWGYNTVAVNGYSIDRHEHRNLSHHEYLLHGEAPSPKFNGFTIPADSLKCNSVDDKTWTLTCVGNAANGSIFHVAGDFSGILTREYIVNTQFISAQLRFTLYDNGSDFNIGDKVVINAATKAISWVPSKYSKFNGLNQWFVNLNRYNSVDMSISLADNILRDWDLKLGYRMSGLVNTELLSMKTDQFSLNNSGYDVVIKQNKGISDHWLNAIRIQLIRIGTTVTVDGVQKPRNKGEDWVFRIETFNPHYPNISYYEYDKAGKFLTFNAFEKANSQDEWKSYKTRTNLVTRVAPFTVTGIENVANIIFGYVDRLQEEGWAFNQGKEPMVDTESGRVINWQMFIERFINQQYLGVEAGTGIILNPFATSVWFKTPHGFVSNMRNVAMTDAMTSQTVFDSFGNKIHESDIQVFRNDDVTEIQSGVVMGGIHLIVDEFEHIALFEDYIYDKSRPKLIYDPFLGVRVNRIHVSAERQVTFNGRLSFGGHYIKDHKVARNIEASITDMLNYYDADKMIDNSQTAKHARGLLGYDPKAYMSDIDLTDKSQFGFWRGLVSNKGSNLSVNAFLNSARFESAKIDEFWAYKLAEFGDSRPLVFPEIKMSSTDTQHNYTKINFTGTGTSATSQPGFINISSDDESRWVSADDLDQDVSFVAEKLAELKYEVDPSDHAIHDIVSNGKKIIVDTVQVFVEVLSLTGADQQTPYLVQLADEDFTLINSSTIKFNGAPIGAKRTATNKFTFVVRCFGPSQPKFNPAKLIDYKNKVIVSDLSLWDPARGSHTPEALQIVDMISPVDPAKFNYSVRTSNNVNYDAYRPWDKKDVGRVWWNTKDLEYIPYSDKQIFPSLDTRLSYWGALADYSKIELYEWTESTVHPSKYADLVSTQEGDSSIPADVRASGEVALSELYTRKRTWRQRPIAWGYTDVPGSVVPYLSSVGEYRVKFITDLAGGTIAILSGSDWISSFPELAIGMKISGGIFHYNTDDVSDSENFKLSKPYGEAVLTGLNQDLVIGSSSSFDSPMLVPLQH